MRIAIVGTGIAGLTVAYRLRGRHELTLYEAGAAPGGHTATVDVEWQGRQYAIDTGFIVCNDWTYPNFLALLAELGVPTQRSNMSFSLRCERSGLEYNGTSLNALFAQRRNLFNVRFLWMLANIARFNIRAPRLLATDDDRMTLDEYLTRHRYPAIFREHYIEPMGRAIWSATASQLRSFPARFFVDFFHRHGFLNVNNRPVWRAICGGSREYVRKLLAVTPHELRLNAPVICVTRDRDAVRVRTACGDVAHFDYVFIACHSDQALALLADPSPAEREILGAIAYQANDVALHTDDRLLPRTPLARAAWNYHLPAVPQDRVAVTYDMNVLQNLDAPVRFLVTLNRAADIDPDKILRRFVYHHPVYTPAAVRAQRRRGEISGQRRSFYCGAYWRYGFHEDGVVSALWALEEFARVTAHGAVAVHGNNQ
ncbi:MAG: FAD-dependent oxidoreductase [Steroidobacteraceae bacterium]|nr:FAD-dependent oxidoreductase [Steroidobacteraceae bacterium]MDW8260426.1 FAD-dependent oxidoreductase [Gammaproteobacteria bacterium]